MPTSDMLFVFLLANFTVKNMTIMARTQKICPQRVAFKFINKIPYLLVFLTNTYTSREGNYQML
ncbi:hypothetical protein HR45_16015 [Shewanella mangrovi]|uniref:Uncharacterized protein n=1 Tax=Shewanella mangrovi TaxID=1515746 RepID=A0A094JVL8_9GAMM|nr:hypothetical protein HR45_16015 [Shewanella mangrovi]